MEESNPNPSGFDPEILSDKFDKLDPNGGGTMVVTQLPDSLTLKEVVGIQHYQKEGKTKATYRKGKWLYLCVFDTKDFSPYATKLIHEIKNREDWRDRYEPWELYGEQQPFQKVSRILKSRCKTKEELKEWELFYG